MSDHATFPDPALEAAANQMRSLIHTDVTAPPWFDAAAVQRMLAHVDNIHRSVTASTTDHVNAAKRLNDFARTFARFAVLEPRDGPFALRMTTVSDCLRQASDKLSRGGALAEVRATENEDTEGSVPPALCAPADGYTASSRAQCRHAANQDSFAPFEEK